MTGSLIERNKDAVFSFFSNDSVNLLDPQFKEKVFLSRVTVFLMFEWNLSLNMKYHWSRAGLCIGGDRNRLLMPQASANYQLLPWLDCSNGFFHEASTSMECT